MSDTVVFMFFIIPYFVPHINPKKGFSEESLNQRYFLVPKKFQNESFGTTSNKKFLSSICAGNIVTQMK